MPFRLTRLTIRRVMRISSEQMATRIIQTTRSIAGQDTLSQAANETRSSVCAISAVANGAISRSIVFAMAWAVIFKS